jgi:aarF domain-containing kinase
MDYYTMRDIAKELGIGEYFRYLPLLFTYRTINTTKKLGASVAPEEKEFLKGNDEVNLEKIGKLMEILPTDLLFIFKAMHIIGSHNVRAGGTTRERLMKFTDHCVTGLTTNSRTNALGKNSFV